MSIQYPNPSPNATVSNRGYGISPVLVAVSGCCVVISIAFSSLSMTQPVYITLTSHPPLSMPGVLPTRACCNVLVRQNFFECPNTFSSAILVRLLDSAVFPAQCGTDVIDPAFLACMGCHPSGMYHSPHAELDVLPFCG